jgi:hypothetical protein
MPPITFHAFSTSLLSGTISAASFLLTKLVISSFSSSATPFFPSWVNFPFHSWLRHCCLLRLLHWLCSLCLLHCVLCLQRCWVLFPRVVLSKCIFHLAPQACAILPPTPPCHFAPMNSHLALGRNCAFSFDSLSRFTMSHMLGCSS